MSVHDQLGGRLSVHERLGRQVGYFPRNQEELEEMTNARVLDAEIFYRDPNIHRVESMKLVISRFGKLSFPDGVLRA